MNKYLNIIVIAFFSILTVRNDIAYTLVLPVILIYAVVNSRSLVLMIPVSLLSVYIFKHEYFVSLIIMYIFVLVYILILIKKQSVYIDIMFIFLVSMGLMIFIKSDIVLDGIYIDIIYAIIATVIFVVVKYLIKINQGNFVYFEVLAITTALLGSTTIEFAYNIPFMIACFYAMYFSCNTSVLFSEFFSIGVCIALIYFYNLEIALILPFISAIYSLNSILSSFVTVVLGCMIGLFYNEYFNQVLIINAICIAFELLKFSVVINRVSKKDTYEDIYKKSIEILNNDILAFSSFLDMCTKEAQSSKEYLKIIDEGIKSFKVNYCYRCYLNERCFQENVNMGHDMKRLIIDVKKKDFDISSIKSLSICPYNIEMKKSALLINGKINSLEVQNKNKIISKAFNNISTMLRQYTIDNNIKKEIDYNYLYKMKRALVDNGYNISYFEPIKIYEDNFAILIGIRGFIFKDIKEDVESIINSVMNCDVTVEYSHTEKGKVYIKVVPKRNCMIEYASTNIAQGVISGDNILVENNIDGKTIALICDGMGKGSYAGETSFEIVQMIEKLLKTSVSTYATLQILNTYCGLKSALETYSTLDFLEVDKKNSEAIFYKLSAAPSYIYHQNRGIEKIENNRLPLGNESEVDSVNVKIESGDIIIMTSDGIFENIVNESELENFISSITYLSVEKIVYQIINYVKNTVRLTEDDISLIVLKVLPS